MMQEDSNGDFEIVDKKMATLLTTESSGGASGASSVLTNVSPPTALPSFIASPLPTGPPPPHGPNVVPPTGPILFNPADTNAPKQTVGAQPPPPGTGPVPPHPIPSAITSSPSPYQPPSPSLGSRPPSIDPTQNLSPSPIVTSPTAASPPLVPSPGHPQSPPSSGSVDASVDLGSPGVGGGPRPGWFGWIRGTVSNVGQKVAEKAKSSMDTMITTLDPQMKEFIHSGGDMDIVVASDKEVKVGALREAFQSVFGKATVVGMAAQSENVAAQPVGFAAALQAGEERINCLRSSGRVHPQQPVVSIENFIVELTPECWYDLGLLLLDDPGEDIILQTYTQVTPIPPTFVSQAKATTPEDYPFKDTGFSTTMGHIASQSLQVQHSLWQETLTGVPRRDLIVLAARTLAGLYRSRLPRSY